MRVVRVEDEHGRAVCTRCEVADRIWTRFLGLMGRRRLAAGDGMLFRPGGSVHMFFMRFPLDVVFLDADLRIVGIASDLRPWRIAGRRGAKLTLELASGEAARHSLQEGARLRLVERP